MNYREPLLDEFPESVGETPSASKQQQSGGKFRSVSAETARKAKKGNVSASRTGKARQASIEFGKPPKYIWVQVDPRPEYRQFNVPVFQDKDRDQTYYVEPSFYESDDIPERFKRACSLIDIHAAARADGGFFLWTVNVSTSKWRKSAVRAVQAATGSWVMIESNKASSTYMIIDPEGEDIPAPKFEKLESFDSLLEQAFDGSISHANNEVVLRFLAGGNWTEEDED